MKFRGLFVGIDRYASPNVNWLSCAKRDATALHALFSDSLGLGAELLTDSQATRSAIETALSELSSCDDDDVVVLGFSGHGTRTHQLVTYDCDPARLDSTSIPLEKLAALFSRIPAKRLVCFLDCCFSGGLGAKVLQTDVLPRDIGSAEDFLNQLSGNGRLIFTASTATQPAWENQRLGHGLLTWFLLEALQGATEVVQAGKIAVYRLLEHVTQRVTAEAAKLGKQQQPTVRGKLDGELTWPVFSPGNLYLAAFPERSQPKATSDIQRLAAFGFPADLLRAWATNIPTLNDLQVTAINEFHVLQGDHLLVSAPTSSGKTMVGELAALKGALERRRTLFLLPLRALVNDKHQYFLRTYSSFGLRTIRTTGEITDDIPDLMRGRFDICLMTYEKFAALALAAPHILDQAGTIVVDEVQMIADPSRGVNLEFILTVLQVRRREGVEPQLIALSAVIGDTFGFERWLGARLLRKTERPVPLDEGILSPGGDFRYQDPAGQEKRESQYIEPRYGKGSSQDYIIPLVQKLVAEGKQVIVFRETKGEARGCAAYLARELGLPPAQAALAALPASDPSQASTTLRETLAGGVAFHNSDLERDERMLIEQAFRAPKSEIRVIAATTTLAMGINTPAEAVIIAGLQHPGDPPTPYSVAEYKNMVGRAGRLGFVDRGSSFLIALSANDEYHYWERYVCGKPEDLMSHFLSPDTDPRSLIIRVLAAAQRVAAGGLKAEDLIEFLHSSFGAFLQRQSVATWQWDRAHLNGALADLETHELVKRGENGGYVLTALGRLAGQAGIEVESVIRLVDALRGTPPSLLTDPTLIAATQFTVELDQVLFPLNKKSTQKEPQTWDNELRRQGVASLVMSKLDYWAQDKHQPTLRAKKAVACLYWITGTSLNQIEATLTQFGGAFDGAAGPVRAVSTRTADLLDTVFRVAELVHQGLDLTERRARLLTRLQLGIPGKCVQIAEVFGNNLTRGDYQTLLKENLVAIDALEAAPESDLIRILGNNAETRRKVALMREMIRDFRLRGRPAGAPAPLPPYEP
jgi:helicase